MKSFFRFLWRNRLYSAINFIGLTVALAFCIIILNYTVSQVNVARSVPDGKNLYALSLDNETIMCYGMADMLRSSIPEAEEVTRFTSTMEGNIVEYGQQKFSSVLTLADADFFNMFHVRFISGGAWPEDSQSEVIVSGSFARKIAEEGENLVGKDLTLNGNTYTICGVSEDFGDGLLKYTDIIANISAEELFGQYSSMPWNIFGPIITIMKVAPGTDIEALENKIDDGVRQIKGDSKTDIGLICMDDMYFHKGNLFLNQGNIKLIHNLTLAGIALLVSALFNYINLNTALAGKRAKEMAVKRLLGSRRREILLEYIREAFIFTTLCFILSIAVATAIAPFIDWILTDPASDSTTGGIDIRDFFSLPSILAYIAIIAAVSCISGIVPATIASKYTPVDVVKGTFRMKSKMVFTKVFIVAQNILSVVLVAVAITMEAQMKHMMERPAGCDLDDIYYISSDFENEDGMRFAGKLRSLPCVEAVGICDYLPGDMGSSYVSYDRNGDEETYRPLKCDTVTFNMLKFDIIEQYGENIPGAVWTSLSAARAAGVDKDNTDLSRTVTYDRTEESGNTLTGILGDFIIDGAGSSEKKENAVIYIVNPEDFWIYNYAIKTKGDHAQAKKMIDDAYNDFCKEIFGVEIPAWTIDYMTDYLADSLDNTRRSMRLIEIFMVLSIILSLSGLVAISIFYADSNIKSIALHKIYGGTVGSEMRRTIMVYMIMTLIADIVAVPVALILCRRYLQEFAYRIDLEAWIFIVTVVISLVITAVSVIWQVSRAARTNPAEALKSE